MYGKFFSPHASSTRSTSPVFTPDGAKLLTLTSPRLSLVDRYCLRACVDCGVVWSECFVEKFGNVIKYSLTSEALQTPNALAAPACPRCAHERLIPGTLSSGAGLSYRPDGLRFFTFIRSDVVLQARGISGSAACPACGLVLSRVNVQQLKETILRHGRERTIKRVIA